MHARIVMMPILVLVSALQAVAAGFYVAPDGNDANAGSREEPFQTLERARDGVREHRETHGPGDQGITVILREGRHTRNATFSLSAADSGAPGAPVVYKAAEGEAVSIDGGHVLEPGLFEPVTDEAVLGRLLESASGRVLQADLRALGITEYGDVGPRGWGRPNLPAPMELFIDGIPQRVARWPNDGHIVLGEVLAGGQDESDQPGVFKHNTDRAARWTEAEDLYISGLFGVTWAHDTVGIASIDLAAGTFTTKHPHSYGFRQPGFPGRFTTQYYAVNLLEEIEEPGEYYIDRDAGILYFLRATSSATTSFTTSFYNTKAGRGCRPFFSMTTPSTWPGSSGTSSTKRVRPGSSSFMAAAARPSPTTSPSGVPGWSRTARETSRVFDERSVKCTPTSRMATGFPKRSRR